MILRSPFEIEDKLDQMGSRRASGAKKKYQQNATLWQLAAAAMATVDPEFAEQFTGLAVTQGFSGACFLHPHVSCQLSLCLSLSFSLSHVCMG